MSDTDFYANYRSGFCVQPSYGNHDGCPGSFGAYGKTPAHNCTCECHDGKPVIAHFGDAFVNKQDDSVSDSKPVVAKVAAPVRVAPAKAATVSVDGLDIGAVRVWAKANKLPVGERGRIAIEIKQAYIAAHS